MLSRVAKSIYWMSRQIERAENVGRCVDVNLHLLLDLPGLFEGQWGTLVKIAGDYDDFHERYGDPNDQSVIEFLTFDRENPNSVVSCVTDARENARSIREIISSDTWEELNIIYLDLTSSGAQQRAKDDPAEFFRQVRRAGTALTGVMFETMSREEAWHFSRMGRLLERADQTTRILDLKYFLLLPDAQDVGTPIDDVHWLAILRSAGAFEMYRKAYGRVAADNIVRFLVLDALFPRSVHYCVNNAEISLRAITGTPYKTFRNSAEHRLGRLASDLDYTDHKDIVRDGLHQFLDDIQTSLNHAGDGVAETFFSLKPVQ